MRYCLTATPSDAPATWLARGRVCYTKTAPLLHAGRYCQRSASYLPLNPQPYGHRLPHPSPRAGPPPIGRALVIDPEQAACLHTVPERAWYFRLSLRELKFGLGWLGAEEDRRGRRGPKGAMWSYSG